MLSLNKRGCGNTTEFIRLLIVFEIFNYILDGSVEQNLERSRTFYFPAGRCPAIVTRNGAATRDGGESRSSLTQE